MSDALSPQAVAAELAQHADWIFDGGALARTFDCKDFNGSMAFVNAIAGTANRLDHHPDIAIAWNLVTVRSSSHDVDGISPRDFALIAAIDSL